jgi:hypothetical protein
MSSSVELCNRFYKLYVYRLSCIHLQGQANVLTSKQTSATVPTAQLTPCSRVLLKTWQSLTHSRNSIHLKEPKCSRPWSKAQTTGLLMWATWIHSTSSHSLYLNTISISSSDLNIGSSSDFFPSGFQARTLNSFTVFRMRATYPAIGRPRWSSGKRACHCTQGPLVQTRPRGTNF